MRMSDDAFPLIFKRATIKRPSGKKMVQRLMKKSGNINVQQTQIARNKYLRFTQDFANTLVLIRWRWVTLLVIVTNGFFYILFAGLWMFDAWLSGDLSSTKNGNFCIPAANTFTGYLLLSIETITTTGYGYLYPTEHCQIAFLIHAFSTICTILLDGAFISIVFLKVIKPLRKDARRTFSQTGVICLRNGKFCLIFRIDDHTKKHAIEPKITVYFWENSENLTELQVRPFGMLAWPCEIVHQIDGDSPLWALSPADLMSKRFEIFLTISGSSLVTNQFATSQTSYLNHEIFWGYRFERCLEFDEKIQIYRLRQEKIFKIKPCDTPLCSAQQLEMIKDEL